MSSRFMTWTRQTSSRNTGVLWERERELYWQLLLLLVARVALVPGIVLIAGAVPLLFCASLRVDCLPGLIGLRIQGPLTSTCSPSVETSSGFGASARPPSPAISSLVWSVLRRPPPAAISSWDWSVLRTSNPQRSCSIGGSEWMETVIILQYSSKP